jgi:hypothetical protein
MGNIDPAKLTTCPTCAAAVPEDFLEEHIKWHAEQHPETGQTGEPGQAGPTESDSGLDG